MENFVPPAAETPVPQKSSSGKPVLWGVLLFIAGLVVGAAAVWYLVPHEAAPEAMESPSPSPPDAEALPSVSAEPKVSFASFDRISCVSAADCTYDIYIDARKIGQISSWQTPPGVVRIGPGWVVFERQGGGLGGYILYAEYLNPGYANANGTILDIGQGLVDADFLPDLSRMVFTVSEFNEGTGGAHHLEFLDLEEGVIDQVSVNIPTTGMNPQAGRPTFSPDGSQVAVAVGYGPDNERGEIYVGFVRDLSFFNKIADIPRPVQELWWKSDGSIGWR